MNRTLLSLGLLLFFCSFMWFSNPDGKQNWNEDTSIYTVLSFLGEPLPEHARENATAQQIQQGYELVHQGRTTGPDGKQSKYISKYYFCTSCHNQVQEDPDLRYFDPEARLDYAIENRLKFLPGSGFYGIANRETWYNDDYYKKYGDLVKPAKNSLAEATQLCAKVCSSGRYLEDWELEAILAYYWSIQIKLGDLALSEAEWSRLKEPQGDHNQELIEQIKSKYALKSPATFGDAPADRMKGFGLKGNPERGKAVYELSCMACHQEGGVSDIAFDYSKLTFKRFMNKIGKSHHYNIYDISRYGTYTESGKPRYMPLYPKERLSDQQLEDLRAYMQSEVNR